MSREYDASRHRPPPQPERVINVIRENVARHAPQPPPVPPHVRHRSDPNIEHERNQRTERREHEKRRSTIIQEKAYVKKKASEANKPNVSALANNSLETGDGLGDIEFLERSRYRSESRRYNRPPRPPSRYDFEFDRYDDGPSNTSYSRPPRPSSLPGAAGPSRPTRPSDEEIERRRREEMARREEMERIRRERWRRDHDYSRPIPATYMPIPPPGGYPPPRPRPDLFSPVSSLSGGSEASLESDEPPVQTSRAAPRVSIASRLPKRSKVKHKPIDLWFGMFIDGELRLSHKKHAVQYFTNRREEYNDVWLIDNIKREYGRLKQKRAGRLSRWLWSLRTIGFASFKRWEYIKEKDGWFKTAQQGIFDYVDEKSSSRFQYRLRNPPKNNDSDDSRVWLARLDQLAEQTNNDCYFQVELFELPHAGRLYTLLFFAVLVSTGGGVAYAVVTKDVGTGLSLSSYVITCIALALALLALGEFLGLERPDSFSFAYDVFDGLKVEEDTGKETRNDSMRDRRRRNGGGYYDEYS